MASLFICLFVIIFKDFCLKSAIVSTANSWCWPDCTVSARSGLRRRNHKSKVWINICWNSGLNSQPKEHDMIHNYQLDQYLESVNVELLVQCVRSSKSTQTQHEALLVMASIAHLFPVCWNVQVPLQSIKQLKPGYSYLFCSNICCIKPCRSLRSWVTTCFSKTIVIRSKWSPTL